MDKKLQLSRQRQGQSKPKSSHPPQGLIALGSSTRPETPENFPSSGNVKASVAAVKRDLVGFGVSVGLPPKKARMVPGPDIPGSVSSRVGNISSSTGLATASTVPLSRKEPTNDSLWLSLATSEFVASEFLAKVKAAEDKLKTSRVPKYICSAVKLIAENKHKPIDPVISVALSYLVNHNPAYFQETAVIEAFCSLLKRLPAALGPAKVGKQDNKHAVFVCNLLLKAFLGVETWPATFVKVFLDDSLSERSWVDKKECQTFVKNILTAFGTVPAPPEFLVSLNFGELGHPSTALTPSTPPSGGLTPSRDLGSPGLDSCVISHIKDEDSMDSGGIEIILDTMEEGEKQLSGVLVKNRFDKNGQEVRDYAVQLLQDWWSRRLDITPKNLLRTMSSVCGLVEVRLSAAQKLETWLQNPKLQKVALELLMMVCVNSPAPQTQTDLDILGGLTRIRGMKNKPVLNVYFSALKEMFVQESENLGAVMKLVVHNELSPTARAPNNMLLLHQCFQFDLDKAAEILGNIFAEFLFEREDFLKALRQVLRDMARAVLRNEFPMVKVGSALLAAAVKKHKMDVFDIIMDRAFMSLVDLVCLTVFLGVTPAVKEAAQSRKDLFYVRKYQRDVGEMMRRSVEFMQKHPVELYTPTEKLFTSALFRLLFMDKTDFYSSKDGWPNEQEKNVLMRIINDAPLLEETLLNVLSMGLSEKHPIGLSDAMELADAIVRRAAYGYAEDHPTLTISNLQLIDLLFNSCVFHVPKNISLPSDYELPLMAVTLSYWKSMIILVVVSAYNPVSIGNLVWAVYPTCRFLMEMAMIQEYTFPPVTSSSDDKSLEALKAEDVQECELEKHKIIDLENFLASLSTKVAITEHNSHLLSKVMDLNPKGPGRKPPDYIVEQLKTLNQQLSLGMLLCKSRNPDFLLQIINRQGASSSSPWLIRLIESNEGSLDVLPIQCLCEFYLHQLAASSANKLPSKLTAGRTQSGESANSTNQMTSTDSNKAGHSGLTKREKLKKDLEEQNQAVKVQRIEEMKRKLSEILWDENETVESVEQALMYFLNRLQAETLKERNVAWRALDELLTKNTSSDQPAMEVDEKLECSGNWLFDRLPMTPKFGAIRKRVCDMLRKSCLVETDIGRLCDYIEFVTNNSGNESPKCLAEDFSQMIVDRQLLMKAMFPALGLWPQRNRKAFCKLMKTLSRYLKSIREKQEELIQWSTNQNEIIVEWSKEKRGESAIVRVTVVHAMIIMLCFPHGAMDDDSEAQAAAQYIENVWFPNEGVAPRAYLVDTTEDAELTPDWLKAKMLQSERKGVVEAALSNLDTAQILMFLQMFGLPVNSVSKLLALLDAACEKSEVRENLSAGFLGCAFQFVKAHRARGSTGGEGFLKHFEKKPLKLEATEEEMEISDGPTLLKISGKPLRRQIGLFDATEARVLDWKVEIPKLFDATRIDSESSETWRALIGLFSGIKMSSAKEQRNCLTALVDWLKAEKGAELWTNLFGKKLMRICAVLEMLENQKDRKVDTELETFAKKIMGNCKITVPEGLKSILKRLSGTKDSETTGTKSKTKVAASILKLAPRSLSAENRERDVKSVVMEMKKVKEGETKLIAELLNQLISLDPDLVKVCPEEELLGFFGRNGISGQKYILNCLPHKVRLPVLNNLLGKLLKLCDKRLNPSLVLDFVWACGNLPQVYRGRDKNLPRHYKVEDVLGLSDSQIVSLVDYTVEECADVAPMINPVKEASELVQGEGMLDWTPLGLGSSKDSRDECREEKVKQRLDLILLAVAEDKIKLHRTVERLLSLSEGIKTKERDRRKDAAQLLLLELYLVKSDEVAEIIPKSTIIPIRTAVHAGSGKFDVFLHQIIVDQFRLAETPKTLSALRRLSSALNKLGTAHPTLVLRQLSLMAALMRGLPDWTMRKYYGSNVLQLLKDVLELLHILKPTLFDRHYSGPLQDLLNTFLDFTKNHGLRNPKLVLYVDSTLELLEDYYTRDSEAAAGLLDRSANLIQIIHMRYPELPHGKSLISQLRMPMSASELQQAVVDAQEAMGANYELTPNPLRPPSPVGNQQARNLLLRLGQAKNSRTELTATLNEIEDVSLRKPDCIQYFKGELETLLTHGDAECRRLALKMLASYLKGKCGKNEGLLESYVLCLTHSDPEISKLAMEFLGDFLTAFRERASFILKCAFQSKITWDVETTKKVNEAIQAANLKWDFTF